MIFPQFIPMILPMRGGGGSSKKPKSNGKILLLFVFLSLASFIAGYGYFRFGSVGLMAVPMATGALIWMFIWGWVAAACLDHGMYKRGVIAGLYFAACIISMAVLVISLVGTAMFVIIRIFNL